MRVLVLTVAACIALAGCGRSNHTAAPLQIAPPMTHAQQLADVRADRKRALVDELSEGDTPKVKAEYAAAYAKAQRYGLCIDNSVGRSGCYPNSTKLLPPGNWTPKGYVDLHGALIVTPSQRNDPV